MKWWQFWLRTDWKVFSAAGGVWIDTLGNYVPQPAAQYYMGAGFQLSDYIAHPPAVYLHTCKHITHPFH
jgi:hypothetical protein